MKLVDLKPEWIAKTHDDGEFDPRNAISFDCPKCGAHRIEIPKNSMVVAAWKIDGENFEDLFISPSIANKTWVYTDIDNDPTKGYECKAHFYVKKGEIEMLAS